MDIFVAIGLHLGSRQGGRGALYLATLFVYNQKEKFQPLQFENAAPWIQDDFPECFGQQEEICHPRLLQSPLIPDSEAQDQSLLDQNEVRFQELPRLSVGADAIQLGS